MLVEQLSQRRSARYFVDSRFTHVPAHTEQLGTDQARYADRPEPRPAAFDDRRDVGKRLDVVDQRRLIEQSALGRKGRFGAWLAALAFHGVHQRGLFATDVRASAAADLDQLKSRELTGRAERLDRVLHTLCRQRVFAADVDVASPRVDGESGDQHRFQDGERIFFEEFAVLERPGLAFVGVADHVPGSCRGDDSGPFATGGERRATAPHQLRGNHLVDHRLRTNLTRAPQSAEPPAAR